MRPNVQSRIGNRGTCFRAALASILNLREADVPDFKAANQDPGVDRFLRPLGLQYEERPIDLNDRPVGYHTILGISPRGGYHAVVGYKGNFVHDPHPVEDDPRRGLVKEKMWGELLPLESGAKATDSKAAEVLRTRHDEIVSNHLRSTGSSAETAYNALYRPTVSLVHDAEVLLTKTRLDDDPAYWHRKLESAQDHLDEAVRLAKSGKYGQATSYLDAALTMAHMVIDKMRKTGSGRARDSKFSDETAARLAWINNKDQKKEEELRAAYHKAVKRGELERSLKPGARDSSSCLTCGKPAKGGEHFCSAACEEQWIAKKFPRDYADMKKRDGRLTDSSSRRERLHRALDHVLDAKKVHTR